MALTPREVADLVRKAVAGEGSFAALFAEDGVLAYPFTLPGMPAELAGREAITQFTSAMGGAEDRFKMEGVEHETWQADDPEVVITKLRHWGHSNVTNAPHQFTSIGVMRVRDGLIVRYEDYMDPINTARLFGLTESLVAALTNS
ncbi:MAG TPA: nuclear transport factor 2 family protein [Trebonia sp.]|nr:nuclear transport factor 2 family protein [Trebonia sp.]